jgi:hypothetical protein
MSKVKQLRIHTIPGIYNRLSASATSQTLVVTQLLEKIVAASKERIPELLRYTLCKVAAQLVSQAQSEFFIIEDEAQSLPVSKPHFPPSVPLSLPPSLPPSFSNCLPPALSIAPFLPPSHTLYTVPMASFYLFTCLPVNGGHVHLFISPFP